MRLLMSLLAARLLCRLSAFPARLGRRGRWGLLGRVEKVPLAQRGLRGPLARRARRVPPARLGRQDRLEQQVLIN